MLLFDRGDIESIIQMNEEDNKVLSFKCAFSSKRLVLQKRHPYIHILYYLSTSKSLQVSFFRDNKHHS
jgi:hypothetical protein